jgi:hypothetical protein
MQWTVFIVALNSIDSSAFIRLTIALKFYFCKHNLITMSLSKKYHTEKLTLVVKNYKNIQYCMSYYTKSHVFKDIRKKGNIMKMYKYFKFILL